MRRRWVLAGLGAGLLGGCGFRPMYAAPAGGGGGAVDGLAAIDVGIIAERPGQLLRQALQARFDRGGLAIARRYDLVVTFAVAGEGIAIQQDNTATWTRYVGTARYTLRAQDATRTTLTSGSARAIDGQNVVDQQYFAQDQEGEAIQRRLADAVADQIALQLAAYFNEQARAAG